MTNKTRPTAASVDEFLATVDPVRQEDVDRIRSMMERITGYPPVLWGPSIVGFGEYRYRYESGREGDWFVAGFSPRKRNLVLYIMGGFPRHAELMERLGTFTTGKSCLYIKRLDDVNVDVLEELIQHSVEYVRASSVGETESPALGSSRSTAEDGEVCR